MLQIDEDAVEALRQMGSLRIRGIEGDGEVELEIEEASEPIADDQVVERDGVLYFGSIGESAIGRIAVPK